MRRSRPYCDATESLGSEAVLSSLDAVSWRWLVTWLCLTKFGRHCTTSLYSGFLNLYSNIACARSVDYAHLPEDAELSYIKTSASIEKVKKCKQFHWRPNKVIQGISSVFLSSILTSCFFGSTWRLPLPLGADALRVCRTLDAGSGQSMRVVAGGVRAYMDRRGHTRTHRSLFSFVQVRSNATYFHCSLSLTILC